MRQQERIYLDVLRLPGVALDGGLDEVVDVQLLQLVQRDVQLVSQVADEVVEFHPKRGRLSCNRN